MATGIRFYAISENTLGEPEHDANYALTEMEHGLRSNNVGEQCEAIVRFPKLFEKYPFPILINSSFIKLAQCFHEGNNFIKLWIVNVYQQSEKHFDKIINIDDCMKTISMVIHSNDPIARALTLRLFGSIASIISERQNVHHSIRCCLDSHNAVEVEAAIYAAEQFAAQSKSFAVSMCNKISDMIQGLTTPVHMKLQLIPILRHMNHDTATSLMVRTVCTELLTKYPAQNFVIVTLKTLTHLAATTFVGIPDQVSLLASYVTNDSRRAIRQTALSCLYQLAKQGNNYWPLEAVSELIDIANTTKFKNLTIHVLDIMVILTKSSAICYSYYQLDSPLMSLCSNLSLSCNPVIAGKAITVITQIACYCYEVDLLEHSEEMVDGIESYILHLMCSNDNKINSGVLKSALCNVVALCTAQRRLCHKFVHLIVPKLLQTTDDSSISLSQALCALCSLEPDTLYPFIPDIYKYLRDISKTALKLQTTMETVCMIIFQCSSAMTNAQFEHTITTADIVIRNGTLWSCYKVARAAARYGHFDVCYRLISRLRDSVSCEYFYFWVVGLQEISIAESNLKAKNNKSLIYNINNAVTNYCKATSSLRAASTPAFSLSFQVEYARLRCEMLYCFINLYSTCNCYCWSPAPAIATALTQSTRDELQRYGLIANQLRRRAKELRHCAEMYCKLYQSSFNADPVSLLNIQVLQFMCTYMAHSVEHVALPIPTDEIALDAELENGPLEIQIMIKNCKRVANIKAAANLPPRLITHKHIECIKKQVELMILTPMCYPRHFFQKTQSTIVTLSVTPSPRLNSEFISVYCMSQLTLKVEGVVKHKHQSKLYRSVTAVVLTVTSHLTARANISQDYKMPADTNIVLTHRVTPQREFFRSEFLLGFSVPGQYQVTIDAALEDQTGFVWQIGTRNSFLIKAMDDLQPSRINRPLV